MKKIFYILLILLVFLRIQCQLFSQTDKQPEQLYKEYLDFYNRGDLAEAENYLIALSNRMEVLSFNQKGVVFNSLGLINLYKGHYYKAIKNFKKAEKFLIDNKSDLQESLGSIFNNLAIIYKMLGEYPTAIDYFFKAANSFRKSNLLSHDKELFYGQVFHNIGITYLKLKDYDKAIINFNKSLQYVSKTNKRIPATYSNLARCYLAQNKIDSAEIFFMKAIDDYLAEYDSAYYKLSGVYMEYGKLLASRKNYNKSLSYYQKALRIRKQNYGDVHPFVSNSLLLIGQHYFHKQQYEKALHYYHKSLHAFHEYTGRLSLFEIPSIQGSFYELQLLRILKSKSEAFARIAEEKNRQDSSNFYLHAALDHIQCAMRLIAKIRGGYMTEDSKLFITEHEKECYISAMRYCTLLWHMTGEKQYVIQAYNFSRQSKAALLQHDIICNNTLFSGNVPDSITERKNTLKQHVKALRRLIGEEKAGQEPNMTRISIWRDEIFSCVQELQNIEQQIRASYPGYENLLQKTGTAPLDKVQACLRRNEVIIEYAIGKGLDDESTSLFTFIIHNDDVDMIHTEVDSLFFQHIGTIEDAFSSLGNSQPDLDSYHLITNSLHQLYLALIQPLGTQLDDKNLVIVPDGELAKIPFDALLTSPVVNKNRINFAALPYLLYQYRISYTYSASLLCRNRENEFIPKHIYAFAPSYGSGPEDQTRAGFGNLQAIFQEIEGIGKWFSQCQFISGQQASKRSFRSVSRDNAILHLAMHATVNEDNHNYSYLAFSEHDSISHDSRLYNYEISLMDIKSPLVVLSACNTGDGAIIQGEGAMSLHRGFLLAGVPSVVHTLWSIEDASSARIMENFYKYLAEGKDKREALHLAKIEYIKTMPPTLVNPYFWSGYALSGDYSKINRTGQYHITWITITLISLIAILLIYYRYRSSLRRRFCDFFR